MAKRPTRKKRRARRQYDDDLKAEAVQMLLDGHTAKSIAENLGLGGTSMLYRWKASLIKESGPAATALESRVNQTSRMTACSASLPAFSGGEGISGASRHSSATDPQAQITSSRSWSSAVGSWDASRRAA